jgi:hypothetical protein
MIQKCQIQEVGHYRTEQKADTVIACWLIMMKGPGPELLKRHL